MVKAHSHSHSPAGPQWVPMIPRALSASNVVRAEASESRRARDLQDSALCIATRSDNVCKGTRDNLWRKFSAGSGLLDAAALHPLRLCISDPRWS